MRRNDELAPVISLELHSIVALTAGKGDAVQIERLIRCVDEEKILIVVNQRHIGFSQYCYGNRAAWSQLFPRRWRLLANLVGLHRGIGAPQLLHFTAKRQLRVDEMPRCLRNSKPG